MAVEEQTQEDSYRRLYKGSWQREGQRLTISNRTVTKLAFILNREPSGVGADVTFTIRKASDGSLIVSKIWGRQMDLPETPTWEEVTFDTPTLINEEVRIGVEFPFGKSTQVVVIRTKLSDVKASEYHCESPDGTYTERTTWDCAYRYTYGEVAAYYHGLKVQSEGELALCDVGTHPLRIRKDSATYGLELVAVDDPNASRVRVKTSTGVKAIRKYT